MSGALSRGDFLRGAAAAGLALAAGPTALAAASPVKRYLYIATDGNLDVYDMARGFAWVKRIATPGTVYGLRGVCASTVTQALYISTGGNGGENGWGALVAVDLRRNRVMWERSREPHGVDSPAISPDGRRIYLPDGALSDAGRWYVIDARNGLELGYIQGGAGAHNTGLSRDGRRLYMGGRNHNELIVADTRTGRTLKRIGPLKDGVRPFVFDRRERYAFTTATRFLGFQISSIVTGKVLHTLTYPGFGWDPEKFEISAPSHGISLSPDERTIWVIDGPNEHVHVFDVSKLPAEPKMIASISTPLEGEESPCRYACYKEGWVAHSRDGRYVLIGDAGVVIDARLRRVVKRIDKLANTRKYIEIHFSKGRVSWAPAFR